MSLAPGVHLGPYEILSPLGAGGMGAVYLAQDMRLERHVALKVLHSDTAGDRDRLHRFVQEAKAASALNHPNILTVHEIGHFEDLHFIATELIKGRTLRERLHAEPLTLREALEIAEQVAAAVNAAHEAGIVHRDIKPENLMIRHDGIVKVLDFGLAKLVQPAPVEPEAQTEVRRLTQAGTMLGTVAYMSPEQALGTKLDARTDLFSLGVVLYEMLTGQQPFTGETASHIIVAILEKEPPPLSQSVEEMPAEIERILQRALAKNPDKRYQNAQALLADLARLRIAALKRGTDNQAIALDPSYALAYAGLAESYALFSWLSVTAPHGTMPKARAAALRALEIDESLPEAHAALGVYLSFYAWDQPANERELRRAIDLNPSYATAHHWLGNIPLLAMGRFDESIAAIERARDLEPLSPIIGSDLGFSLLHARRYDEAMTQFQQTLTLDPKFYVARYHLGATYHAKGMPDAAIAEYEGALQVEDDPWAMALLARALVASGRRDEALSMRDRLVSEAARRYVPNVAHAVVHAALGDTDEAFGWLEKDVAERSLYPPFYAVDPVFDDLRKDPRFAELVRRIERARLD